MPAPADCVFLFDVDNTLLDYDQVALDFHRMLIQRLGESRAGRYWEIFNEQREMLGYADYLGALQHYRLEVANDSTMLRVGEILLDYPYADRLYPGALAVLAHVQRFGPAAIISDGDAVFQPRKILRSGLWDAVEGRVLIYVHKETMLAEISDAYPARHYVMVDDKLRILAAMKAAWGSLLTTVQPRQGHYAADPQNARLYPAADITLERIGDLININTPALTGTTWSTPT